LQCSFLYLLGFSRKGYGQCCGGPWEWRTLGMADPNQATMMMMMITIELTKST